MGGINIAAIWQLCAELKKMLFYCICWAAIFNLLCILWLNNREQILTQILVCFNVRAVGSKCWVSSWRDHFEQARQCYTSSYWLYLFWFLNHEDHIRFNILIYQLRPDNPFTLKKPYTPVLSGPWRRPYGVQLMIESDRAHYSRVH